MLPVVLLPTCMRAAAADYSSTATMSQVRLHSQAEDRSEAIQRVPHADVHAHAVDCGPPRLRDRGGCAPRGSPCHHQKGRHLL